MLMADAIRRAASIDPEKIRRALAATRNFNGVTGPIKFDDNGDPQDKPIAIIKYQNGTWRLLKVETL
jgi:branched-chain amino acid transport system substrate-binding protein